MIANKSTYLDIFWKPYQFIRNDNNIFITRLWFLIRTVQIISVFPHCVYCVKCHWLYGWENTPYLGAFGAYLMPQAKKTLVLVKTDPPPKKRCIFYVSNEEIDPRLVANIPTVIYFFFRFGLTSLYTVVLGCFPRPKKYQFWPKKGIFFFWSDHLF